MTHLSGCLRLGRGFQQPVVISDISYNSELRRDHRDEECPENVEVNVLSRGTTRAFIVRINDTPNCQKRNVFICLWSFYDIIYIYILYLFLSLQCVHKWMLVYPEFTHSKTASPSFYAIFHKMIRFIRICFEYILRQSFYYHPKTDFRVFSISWYTEIVQCN